MFPLYRKGTAEGFAPLCRMGSGERCVCIKTVFKDVL